MQKQGFVSPAKALVGLPVITALHPCVKPTCNGTLQPFCPDFSKDKNVCIVLTLRALTPKQWLT